MQARTTRPDEPGAVRDSGVVEKEVETVRTRQSVAGAPVDAVPATGMAASEQSGGYFETLPERLGAFGLVLLTALEGEVLGDQMESRRQELQPAVAAS